MQPVQVHVLKTILLFVIIFFRFSFDLKTVISYLLNSHFINSFYFFYIQKQYPWYFQSVISYWAPNNDQIIQHYKRNDFIFRSLVFLMSQNARYLIIFILYELNLLFLYYLISTYLRNTIKITVLLYVFYFNEHMITSIGDRITI